MAFDHTYILKSWNQMKLRQEPSLVGGAWMHNDTSAVCMPLKTLDSDYTQLPKATQMWLDRNLLNV